MPQKHPPARTTRWAPAGATSAVATAGAAAAPMPRARKRAIAVRIFTFSITHQERNWMTPSPQVLVEPVQPEPGELRRLLGTVGAMRCCRKNGEPNRNVIIDQCVVEGVRLRDRDDRIQRRSPDERRRRNLRVIRDRRVLAIDPLTVAGVRRRSERIAVLNVGRREVVLIELAIDRGARHRGAPVVVVSDEPRRELTAVGPATHSDTR